MKGTKIKKDFDRSFALFFVPFVLLVVIIDPSASGIGIRIAEPKGFGNPFICRLDNEPIGIIKAISCMHTK
jgi:hypothetical protein